MVSDKELKLRYDSLYSLGMAKSKDGFVFQEITIENIIITDASNSEWTRLLDTTCELIILRKGRLEPSKKTDKEKLQDFIRSLGHITGPELMEKQSEEILKGSLILIHQARRYLIEGIKNLK